MNGQRVGRIGRRRILNGGNVFAGANIKGSVEGDCMDEQADRLSAPYLDLVKLTCCVGGRLPTGDIRRTTATHARPLRIVRHHRRKRTVKSHA
jgi:hypothetical protein